MLPQFLYAIYSRSTRAIKIGISVAPEGRLHDLQFSHGRPLVLLGYCEGGTPCSEGRLLKQLKPYRLLGEWVRDTPEVRRVLSEAGIIRMVA